MSEPFVVKDEFDCYQNKTLRLPCEILRKLEAIASKKHMSLNRLIILCLSYALDNFSEQ